MSDIMFETQRLRCRRLTPEDLGALLEVYGDAETVRWVGDGSPLTEAGARAWLDVTESNYRKRGYGMFALEERATHEVVGFCGLVHPGAQQEPEVKYAFRRTHWGQGLATEAVAALLEYGARRHGLARIIATVAPEHLASQRVLAKVGMSKAEPRHNEDGSQTLVFEWRQQEAQHAP
jgi:ribosomal-protein-alanine N-acetyltransferase